MLTDTRNSKYAKVSALPENDVEWTKGLWKERFDVCAKVTIPHIRALFEDNNEIFHVVENFRIAAGERAGEHKGTPFGDGDFYKWMEAAMYVAAKKNDIALQADLEEYVQLIGRAQQFDGYISTKQIVADKNNGGNSRLGDINDFEVYNFGHLFTAACVYKRVLGRDSFLKIAEKAAEYLERLYEEAIATGTAQTEVCPSHYMGAVELYRTTGKEKYLRLAENGLLVRDLVKDGTDDNQDSLPLRKHRKIVGHGVRSTYLYAGVADVYAENGDEELKEVLGSVWDNCVDKKLYITGGCGALYTGVSPYGLFDFVVPVHKVHQAFGYEYQLPNITAYNETCATLGNIMWNYRMFLADPQVKYFDIIERSMLNLTLASVSLGGNKYFYENMLRRVRELDFDVMWPLSRTEEMECFCCPPNMARFIVQASEYLYTISEDKIWCGMYGASQAKVTLPAGTSLAVIQETEYPFGETIKFKFEQVEVKTSFGLNLRIPEWVSKGSISKNGAVVKTLGREDAQSFYTVQIEDAENTTVELVLDMPVRLTRAHTKVEENVNQVAVERGPLVYCIESCDADTESISDLLLPIDAEYKFVPYEIMSGKMVALETEMLLPVSAQKVNKDALYQELTVCGYEKVSVRMIPYYAWDNRGEGEMKIWLPICWNMQQDKQL